MNRRELLQSLIAIPTAAGIEIQQAQIEPDVQPGDLIVLTTPRYLSEAEMANIKACIEHKIRPKVKVLVLEGGMTLSVHRGVAKVEPD